MHSRVRIMTSPMHSTHNKTHIEDHSFQSLYCSSSKRQTEDQTPVMHCFQLISHLYCLFSHFIFIRRKYVNVSPSVQLNLVNWKLLIGNTDSLNGSTLILAECIDINRSTDKLITRHGDRVIKPHSQSHIPLFWIGINKIRVQFVLCPSKAQPIPWDMYEILISYSVPGWGWAFLLPRCCQLTEQPPSSASRGSTYIGRMIKGSGYSFCSTL